MSPSARRPLKDQDAPVIPPRPSSRHGSVSGREPRLLVKRNSEDNRTGRRKDADGEIERRSRHRSGSAPPDSEHHHDHGQTSLASVSANESWAWGRNWVDAWWGPGRGQVQVQARVQVSGQWVVSGVQTEEGRGRKEGDRRGRRSSDAKRPKPVPALPAPRRTSTATTAEPPVIPGVTATVSSGMGLRNLLRKRSRTTSRPKILFYHKHEPYYGFTNFSPHPVVYRGKRYPTSEHLFQSLKV